MTATFASMTALPKGRRPNPKKAATQLSGPIRVFSIGGSETADYDDTGTVVGSYRPDLHDMVTTRGGLTLTWIGCRAGGPAGHPSRPTHALAGASCRQWLNTIPSGGVGTNALGGLPENLIAFPFNIGILECVVNTANDNAETATWRTDHVDLVTEILSVHPAGRLIPLSPFDAGPDTPRRVNLATIRGQFWDMIDDLYVAGYSDNIYPCVIDVVHRDVDMDPGEPKGDAVHWTREGASLKIASRIFPVFMNAAGYDAVW